MSENTILTIDALVMAYGEQTVINGLSLALKKGEIGCLLGGSGCGKTSVLRTIAGFESPVSGAIWLDEQPVSSGGTIVPPAKRDIAMVFQDYALFPHLSVIDNVAFGLKKKGGSRTKERAMEMLELVDLKQQAHVFPHELSGGQQQRVALARALAVQPRLLLMDEPFSNLDVTLRERLSVEVRQILKKAGTTTLFVTHNQQEAFALADVIGVMDKGKICQWDTPYTVYHEPADIHVADFIGEGSFIHAQPTKEGIVETGLGSFPLPEKHVNISAGKQAVMLIRPEDIVHEENSSMQAEVLQQTFRGAGILYELRIASGERVQALVPSSCEHSSGERIGIRPQVGHVVLFETSS